MVSLARPKRPFGGGPGKRSQETPMAREPFGGNTGIMGTVNAYEDDERELIDRAQSGEVIAFQRLAEQHAALLLRRRWPLARIATGPRILCKRRWSRRGDP